MPNPLNPAEALRMIRTQGAAVGLCTLLLAGVAVCASVRLPHKQETLTLPAADPLTEPERYAANAIAKADACCTGGDLQGAERILCDARDALQPEHSAEKAAVSQRYAMLCYAGDRLGDCKTQLDLAAADYEKAFGAGCNAMQIVEGQRALLALRSGDETAGLEALAALQTAAQSEDPVQRMDACELLAQGYALAGQPADAAQYYADFLELAGQTAQESQQMGSYLCSYGELLLAARKNDEAADAAKRSAELPDASAALKLRQKLLDAGICAARYDSAGTDAALSAAAEFCGEGTAEQTAFYVSSAQICLRAGNRIGAETFAKEAWELAQDSSELTVQFAGAVGSVLEGAGCMADAEAVYQKAAELSPDTPEFLHALCRIGTAGKDYAAAAENGKKALAACEKQYGENARMSIPVLADLALACFYGYDPDAASEYAEKALAIAEKQTRTTPESAAAYLAMGRLSMLMHKDAEAVSYLEQGQQTVAETCGEDSAQNAKALAWLGEACYCAAQYEKASSSYEKAVAYSERNGAAPDTAAQLKERYEAAKKAAKGGSDIPPSY